MIEHTTRYGMRTTVPLDYEQAAERARQALMAEPDIGLLLPCNVIVYADDVPGRSVVAAMDPVEALALTDNESIRPIAEDVRARLLRVLEAVERDAR